MKYLLPLVLATGCAASNNIGNLPTVATFHLDCPEINYTVLGRQQGIPILVGATGCEQRVVFKRRLHQRFGIRTTRNAPWTIENQR